MEHYLDIETERFEKIKEHEVTWILVPRRVAGREIGIGDVLKLYHPGDPTEAIRVEVTDVQTADAAAAQTGTDAGVLKGSRADAGASVESRAVAEVSAGSRTDAAAAVGAGQEFMRVSFVLLEWMCRLETELDELLREEERWMQGLL